MFSEISLEVLDIRFREKVNVKDGSRILGRLQQCRFVGLVADPSVDSGWVVTSSLHTNRRTIGEHY